MSPSWRARFSEVLPEVAERAAQGVVRELITGLDGLGADTPEHALIEELELRLDRFQEVRAAAREVRETLRAAQGLGQRREAMLDVLGGLATGGRLRADRRALRRHLDEEAIEDRLLRRHHVARQPVELLCQVLGSADLHACDVGRVARLRARLLAVTIDRSLLWVVRVAAIRAVGACCTGDGDDGVRAEIRALAEDATQDPWVQSTALGTWLRITPASPAVFDLLGRVLAYEGPDRHADHAFFRARAVGLAARRQAWVQLRAHVARRDPSEHVRMAIVRALATSPSHDDMALLLEQVGGAEPSPRVRAAATLAAVDLGVQPRIGIRVVRDVLGTDVQAVAIVLSGLHYRQRPDSLGAQVARERLEAWRPSLERWRDDAEVKPDVRTDAAAVLLSLELAADEEHARVWREVDRWAIEAEEGETSLLRTSMKQDRLLDVLSLVAQHTQDLGARPVRDGYRLFHGSRPRPALWRLVHEGLHARPDKRQAFSHIIDRLPRGPLLAPSGCMAEVTETTVPGRPVCTPTERWWHPDLPLPSWLMAASIRGPIEVRALPDVRLNIAPQGLIGRATAPARYVRLARTRMESTQAPPRDRIPRYDQAVAKAGFSVTRRGIGGPLLAAGGFGALEQLGDLLTVAAPTARELLALDGNTLPQLAVFSVVVGVGWATTATVRQQATRAARARVPLVIGGWGSRGKSGVERLKAAVFHELGYPVLSKTTGNEAMVVVGLPGREPVEVFLYRPYDRASIVEQREVLLLADRLGVQVLLWECMALNPRYVEILQHDWMRDDFTTITNTYPDHEDIHGPSGVDVARSIATMLPRGTRALTAEQAMTPILAEEARRRGTQLDALSPEAWELLPEDVLSRFPYDEHPRNIALVVALGRALGIRSDVALRAMADKVVPDLGVLKEYGPATIEGRITSFVVGNSANERAGFLSNWQRMRFPEVPDGAGLLHCTALVVNNRRDRLARQGVFARVGALDATVDRLVVIGTNVRPFVKAVHTALDRELLPRLVGRCADPVDLAVSLARQLRRPLLDVERATAVLVQFQPHEGEESLAERVQQAFSSATVDRPPNPEEADPAALWLAEVAWLAAIRAHDGPVDAAVVDGAIALIRARILPLQDPDISGDAITRQVVESTPAGCRLRMLGAANIKGTGLDLVYRWVQLDRVRDLLDEVLGGEVARGSVALRTLRSLKLGTLDRDEVRRRLESGLDALPDAELRLEVQALVQSVSAPVRSEGDTRRGPAGARRALRAVTANLDLDAVVRRRSADRLYADLAQGRVGLERAAQVAKGLVSRQKVD